ncbi:MAG TPA: GNAT family protein [Sporolactobacillaceae bacterium]|nr:GNAT family protein [Sporolactobacillaceae bacterium]
MFKNPLFKSSRVHLTGKRSGDAEIMAVWQEDDVYQRLVDTDFARPVSVEALAASDVREQSDLSHVSFRIRTNEDDRLIGFVALFNIEWNNRCATMAIGIGDEKDRGKGYGAEALQLILNYAFNELNLHRVGLDVISYNQPAIRSYKRAGFKEEGVVREAVFREGCYYDRIYMGILQSEWSKQ